MTCNGRTLHTDIPTLPGLLAQRGYVTHAVGKLHLQPIMAPANLRMPESVAFWAADAESDAQGRAKRQRTATERPEWNGPYMGYKTVDLVIGESHLVTEGGHYNRWLRSAHPSVPPLYQPDAALDGPLDDLDEAWTCAVPSPLVRAAKQRSTPTRPAQLPEHVA